MCFGMLYDDDTTCHEGCVNPEGTCSSMKSLCATEPLAKGKGRGTGRGAGPGSELLRGWFRSRILGPSRGWGGCGITEQQTLESEGGEGVECHRQVAGLR